MLGFQFSVNLIPNFPNQTEHLFSMFLKGQKVLVRLNAFHPLMEEFDRSGLRHVYAPTLDRFERAFKVT